MLVKKPTLLVILGCMLSCTAPADSGTNTADKLKVMEASFLDALGTLDSTAGQTNAAAVEKFRKELGLFVSTTCGHPPDADGSFGESDANVVEFTYSAYISDLGYLQHTRKGNEAPLLLKILTHRINSLISAYPLASRPDEKEHLYMTLFLAYGSNTSADDVRSAAKSKIKHLTSTDQLPFLAALSELGDKEASEILDKNVSKESRQLESLFKRLYKGKDASK